MTLQQQVSIQNFFDSLWELDADDQRTILSKFPNDDAPSGIMTNLLKITKTTPKLSPGFKKNPRVLEFVQEHRLLLDKYLEYKVTDPDLISILQTVIDSQSVPLDIITSTINTQNTINNINKIRDAKLNAFKRGSRGYPDINDQKLLKKIIIQICVENDTTVKQVLKELLISYILHSDITERTLQTILRQHIAPPQISCLGKMTRSCRTADGTTQTYEFPFQFMNKQQQVTTRKSKLQKTLTQLTTNSPLFQEQPDDDKRKIRILQQMRKQSKIPDISSNRRGGGGGGGGGQQGQSKA